jgi:hypothetical protein
MGHGFNGASIVTMKFADVKRLQEHAPELSIFAAAVDPYCDLVQVQQTWDVFANGTWQHTSAAYFRLVDARLDLAGAVEFTAKALQKAKLKRLPRDVEKIEDMGPNNQAVISWTERKGTRLELNVKKMNGVVLTDLGLALNRSSNEQAEQSSIAVDQKGNPLIAWMERRQSPFGVRNLSRGVCTLHIPGKAFGTSVPHWLVNQILPIPATRVVLREPCLRDHLKFAIR